MGKKNKKMTMNTYMNQKKVRLKDYNKKKKSPKKPLMISGGVTIGFGIVSIILSLVLVGFTIQKNFSYEHIKGYVIDVQEYNLFGDFFKSTVEYEVDGQIYKIDRFLVSRDPDNINYKYEVLYNKDNPEVSYLLSNEIDKTVDLVILGILIILIGFIIFKIGDNMPEEVVFDALLEIPNPNDIHLKEVAEEKARLAAEKAAYEAEQARIAAEEAAAKLAAEQEKNNGITPAMKAAMAAQNSEMDIAFLNIDPTKMMPKKEVKKKNTNDDGLNAAEKAAKAAQGMDIVFQAVDPSQFELKKKKVVNTADDGLDPAQRAAKAAAAAEMNISFLPVDPNNDHTARGGHGRGKK